jgi:hypothetical protein
MALSYLGLDPNAVDEESLAKALEVLLKVRPYVRYFSNDKFISDIPNKELCVAMSWSGDYATAMKTAREAGIDIDLRYSVPAEGGALWIDGLYIPTDAPHLENAYMLLPTSPPRSNTPTPMRPHGSCLIRSHSIIPPFIRMKRYGTECSSLKRRTPSRKEHAQELWQEQRAACERLHPYSGG